MATPASRANLKEYALRALGKPVIEINVDDDQLEDRLDEALQYYAQYHYDGIRRTYLKYQLTEDDKTRLKNPNRSSESTTDKKESGVSTTWSEQDNYLVIPESIISIINIFPFSDKLSQLSTINFFLFCLYLSIIPKPKWPIIVDRSLSSRSFLISFEKFSFLFLSK